MIFFAHAGWLVAAAAVGVVGALALWRGQRRERAVSSLRLWRGLGAESRSARRRAVDPLWVLVLLAGVLAALALAGPGWRRGAEEKKSVAAEWAVRSVAGSEDFEVWVRVPREGPAGVDTIRVNGTKTPATERELADGILVRGKGEHADAALLAGGRVAAEARFVRPAAGPEFGVMRVAAAGAAIDPALAQFFEMQQGARINDPVVLPRVVLVKGVRATAEEVAGAALVIAEPDGALPGITLGARVEEAGGGGGAGEGWVPEVVNGTGFSWPMFVGLKDVRARSVREAAFSAEWEVVARAGGRAWVAVRKVEGGGWWVWLGSEPAEGWFKSPGFVVFFATLQERALGGGAPGVVEWRREVAGESASASVVELDGYAGMLAIVLLMGAGGWFMWRGRGR